jgi:hypothetical protein
MQAQFFAAAFLPFSAPFPARNARFPSPDPVAGCIGAMYGDEIGPEECAGVACMGLATGQR